MHVSVESDNVIDKKYCSYTYPTTGALFKIPGIVEQWFIHG